MKQRWFFATLSSTKIMENTTLEDITPIKSPITSFFPTPHFSPHLFEYLITSRMWIAMWIAQP